ncbi:MAG: PAS domain S-box protein [Gemmatimonadota bacterium]|nr:PAS domain S-box protein [Gemmatimonadota bacterium]
MSPPATDPIESRVRRDLVRAFRAQLRTDTRLVLLGHFLVLALAVISLRENAPRPWLGWWAAAVALTTLARAAWHRAADHPRLTERALFTGTRVAVLLQGLAWGIGAAALIPFMRGNDLAVILLGFAGIVASAVGTLVADRGSIGCFVAGLYLPLLLRWLTPSWSHHDVESASFLAVFAVAALVLHRRAHRTLTANLRATARLSLSQQETVKESAYLSGVLRGAPIAIAVLDDAKRVRSVNARFERLFGYSASEVAGQPLELLLVPPDGLDAHLELEQRVKQGEVIGEEVERRTRDGRTITVRASAAVVPDPTSPGMVVLYEDITERRQAEAALRESEARCRGVVEANLAGFCFWERDGRITEANEEFLRIIGYSREELARGGLSWEALCPPDQASLLLPALTGLSAGHSITPFALDLHHKEGSRAPVMFGAALLEDRASHGVAFVVDISARQRAEVELQQKTAGLEAQLDASLDGILIVDANGRTVLSNRRMAEVWGIPREIATDPEDTRRQQFLVQQARHSEDFRARVEYLYAHPTETSREEIELRNGRILDRYSAPVIGPRGQYLGRIWNFRDITEARRAQLAMREARDLAERTAKTRARFLANMSHEIRTPMNAVLGMIEIVLDTHLTAEQRRALGLASASADSLLAIINDVLDFSKIEAGRLELEEIPFDLAHLVQTTTGIFAPRAEQKGLAFVTHLAPGLPGTVRGDPSRLRQILTNLIGNAIKFTEQGEVTVRVRPSTLKDGRTGVWFSVLDTGVGIPREKLSSIFDEFTQVTAPAAGGSAAPGSASRSPSIWPR